VGAASTDLPETRWVETPLPQRALQAKSHKKKASRVKDEATLLALDIPAVLVEPITGPLITTGKSISPAPKKTAASVPKPQLPDDSGLTMGSIPNLIPASSAKKRDAIKPLMATEQGEPFPVGKKGSDFIGSHVYVIGRGPARIIGGGPSRIRVIMADEEEFKNECLVDVRKVRML